MTVRTTMANVISRLRRMVGDPAGTTQTWSDQELQDMLDEHRTDGRYVELEPLETIAAGGASTYLTYICTDVPWEEGATLTDGSYNALTPATAEPLFGRWTFAAHQEAPVLVTGAVFEMNGAAADVLEAWAARLAREFDFSADGASFSRGQQMAALKTLASSYRAMTPVQSAAVRVE